MPSSSWRVGVGEFEEAVREIENSIHALFEAKDELRLYSDSKHGLHLTQGLSAIQKAEFRLAVAKRKLEPFLCQRQS